MFRRVAFFCLVLAALAVSATAQSPRQQQLIPGVTFERQIRFTPQGPVVLSVITAPRPGGVYALVPELAHGTVSGGLAPVTGIQADISGRAAVAGINGDSFTSKGYPTGLVVQNVTCVSSSDWPEDCWRTEWSQLTKQSCCMSGSLAMRMHSITGLFAPSTTG